LKEFLQGALNITLGVTGCVAFLIMRFFLLGIGLIIAHFLCDIDPSDTYSWYSGIWHGLFVVPNFVLSLFGDTLYKAKDYTTMYNVFWWISSIFSILGIFRGGGRR
jgi:hypothetical protein